MTALRRLARGLGLASVWLNRISLAVAALAVVVMLAAAGWQIIARYLLAQPPIWTEELSRYSMVWGGLMGASCAYFLKRDPTLFPEALAVRGARGRILALIRAGGVLLLALAAIWCSLFGPGMNFARGYLARLAGRQAETMDIPMLVFGVAIPVAFSIIVIHVMADLGRAFFDDPAPDENGGSLQ
ncbi:MAG: TRAP transporter small permease [Pikeienuella sp.]